MTGKGLLSVVVGNTPGARGAVVDALLRAAPRALVLAVSIEGSGEGYPTVQRFVSGADACLRDTVSRGATGDPVVILRQDLLSLRRAAGRVHVVLALPEDLDVLPFLVELWQARIGSGSLKDYYDPAPVVVGVDAASFMADLGCVHRAVRLWNGSDRGEPLTPAEVAARQVEAADAIVVPEAPQGESRQAAGVSALVGHINRHALLVAPPSAGCVGAGLPPSVVQPVPYLADDTTFVPLAPGKVLVNPEYVDVDCLPEVLNSWDVLIAPEPDPINERLLEITSMCGKWLSMNVLMIDEKRVIAERHHTGMLRALENWGFEPIPCVLLHYAPFGGSFHCATLDVRRRGTLESYVE
ncbi:hypothetical protein [Streptomyces caelestis]|uniref:hypothetical protein n=1 Tax=Streptomyces caelestis TaxID=36816 RepID=UPI0036F4E8D0